MAIYAYEVVNKSGETIKGQVTADAEGAAIERLQKMGFMVLGLDEVKPSPFKDFLQGGKKVTIGDICLFSRQLATMLDAGIPLTRALFTLGKQADNPTMKKALDEIARNVEGGMNLTDAMKAHPKIFSSLFIGMVQSGEMGGSLEDTLNRLAEQLQKDKSLKDNIKSATFYPTAVGCFAILMFLSMLLFLVPIFVGFFPKDAVLPLPTKIVMGMSNSLRNYWYIWLLIVIGAVFGIRSYLQTSAGKHAWDRMRFKLPAFGPLLHRSVIARFTRTLSSLLASGIPVIQALESAGPTSGSIILAEVVSEAAQRIQEGRSIAEPLEASGIFPPMVTHMVAVGEETGSLPSLLNRIADFYEEEVATLTKGLTAMIEPILLIFVGVVVGGMLISLYLPMFTVITQVGN